MQAVVSILDASASVASLAGVRLNELAATLTDVRKRGD
jgi:hypothetical protein